MYDAFMWFGLGVVFSLLCYLLLVIHSENKKRKENELMWKIRDEVLDSSRFEDMEVRLEVCENKYKRLDNKIYNDLQKIKDELK